jgi:nucleoside-diphosphate-sugar epimerase
MENPIFINDVVNIGNDATFTIVELAKKIIQITGSGSKIVHLPPLPEGDMTRRQPDIANMKKLLNRDFTSLEAGLTEIIKQRNK